MESSTIVQKIIPDRGTCSRLSVSKFIARDSSFAAQAIQSLGATKLGLATQLSEEGNVEALVFATCDSVIYLKYPTTSATQTTQSIASSLAPILSGQVCTLAGFSMARQAVHIWRDLCCRVSAVDLSTVCAPSTREPWSPAKFVKDRVCPGANKFDILELWYPTENDEVKIERICLQAWLAALCVLFFHWL